MLVRFRVAVAVSAVASVRWRHAGSRTGEPAAAKTDKTDSHREPKRRLAAVTADEPKERGPPAAKCRPRR